VTTGKRALTAALVVLVALLSGCGVTDGLRSDDGTLPPPSAPPTTPSPLSAPSPAPSSEAPPGPRQPTGPTRRVEASGIAMRVPAGWLALDAGDLAAGAAGAPELADLAGRSGVTVDQLLAGLAGADLALLDDHDAVGGFVDSLTVLSLPGPKPTGTRVEFGLLQMGARGVLSTHLDTAVGDAVSTTFELTTGPTTLHGVMVVVESGGRTAAITVSAHDDATAQRLARLVTDTVEAA